jgi:hydroxypyruvate isomerase
MRELIMQFSRRDVLASSAIGSIGSLAWAGSLDARESYRPKGNLKQSVCRWCYGNVPLEKLAEESVKLGYKSVELLLPKDILTVKKYGLTCAVVGGADIARGLNRKEYHAKILKELQERIEFAAAEGCRNVICMSGNRTLNKVTVSDEEGLETCAQAIKKVVGLAEQKKVTLVMEGLNSKHDHKDYMYDKTEWGVKLCEKVGSDRFKLLYDIYHMQIMEGDVIETIRKYKDYIAHYHTGGVPGRHEIDESQELHYPAIVQAILQTGFDGYLAQEYIPKKGNDPLQSLAVGFRVCDV